MHIEIDNPELERLLEERLKAGKFASVEDLLLDTLQSNGHDDAPPPSEKAANLAELLAPIRGLLTDEEIDHCFGRERSVGRSVDLS